MGEVSGRRDNLSLKVTYDIPTLVEQLPNDGFAYVSSEFIFEFPTRSPRIWSYAYCWPTWSADHPLALQRLSTGKLSLRVPFNVREVSWQKQLPPKVPESKFQDLVVVWEPEK